MSWGLLAQVKALWGVKPAPEPVRVAMGVVSGNLAPEAPVLGVVGVVAEAPRKQQATLGMQGHAPIVAVTKYRHGTKCKCGERVLRGVRHVCLYNAENYIGRMTDEEVARVMRQLQTINVPGPEPIVKPKRRAARKR